MLEKLSSSSSIVAGNHLLVVSKRKDSRRPFQSRQADAAGILLSRAPKASIGNRATLVVAGTVPG